MKPILRRFNFMKKIIAFVLFAAITTTSVSAFTKTKGSIIGGIGGTIGGATVGCTLGSATGAAYGFFLAVYIILAKETYAQMQKLLAQETEKKENIITQTAKPIKIILDQKIKITFIKQYLYTLKKAFLLALKRLFTDKKFFTEVVVPTILGTMGVTTLLGGSLGLTFGAFLGCIFGIFLGYAEGKNVQQPPISQEINIEEKKDNSKQEENKETKLKLTDFEKLMETAPEYNQQLSVNQFFGFPMPMPRDPLLTTDQLENILDNYSTKLDQNLKQKSIEIKNPEADYYVEKRTIEPSQKVTCIGDIHSSLQSVIRNIKRTGVVDDNFNIKDGNIFVFTGDYTDRGHYGCETIAFIAQLAAQNPDKCILLRGNHEEQKQNQLSLELTDKYNPTKKKKTDDENKMTIELSESDTLNNEKYENEKQQCKNIGEKWQKICAKLPTALSLNIKNINKKILFCHGSLPIKQDKNAPNLSVNPPELGEFLKKNVDGVMVFSSPQKTSYGSVSYESNDFLWSDILNNLDSIESSKSSSNGRGIQGLSLLKKVLKALGFLFMVRGHQLHTSGTKLFACNNQCVSDPIYWQKKGLVTEDEKKSGIIKGGTENKQHPVITLSTATELSYNENTQYDSYIVIDPCTVPPTIKLCDFQLPNERAGKGMKLEKNNAYDPNKPANATNDPIKTTWIDIPNNKNEKLIQEA